MEQTRNGAHGENMKTSVMLFVLVSGVLAASMQAAAKTDDQPATVVSVELHELQSNPNYAGPLDLPLKPEVYSYDIGIRVGSTIYRTIYDSAFENLPVVLTPNHPIQVNLGNYLMHATLPGGRALRMAIDSRSGL